MKFEDFKIITEKFIEHNNTTNNLCHYINSENVFEPLEMCFDKLLQQLYNEQALEKYYNIIFKSKGKIVNVKKLNYESLYKFMEENKA